MGGWHNALSKKHAESALPATLDTMMPKSLSSIKEEKNYQEQLPKDLAVQSWLDLAGASMGNVLLMSSVALSWVS